MNDIQVEFTELDIAAAIALLKAYSGSTGMFPASVLLLGHSAWHDVALKYLRQQRARNMQGIRTNLRKDLHEICDTPYRVQDEALQ